MTLNTLTTPSTWDKPGLRPHPNTPQHRAACAKKTVVALARQLAVDLWRWRTGRCTMADLGWVAA